MNKGSENENKWKKCTKKEKRGKKDRQKSNEEENQGDNSQMDHSMKFSEENMALFKVVKGKNLNSYYY